MDIIQTKYNSILIDAISLYYGLYDINYKIPKFSFDKINKIRDRASEKFGVNSTPTFFINGDKYTGEINYADFEKIIAAKSSK